MVKSIIAFLILFSFSFTGFAYEVITPTSALQIIGKKIQFYEDPNRELTIQDAWDKRNNGDFSPSQVDFFNKPSSKSSYWFTFSIKTDLEDIWININNHNLDSVHFYLLNDNGEVLKKVITGSILPKNTREFEADTYWFEITRNQDTLTKHIFIKAFSGLTMEIPLELGSFRSLLSSKSTNDFYAHFFVGSMVVMLLYNLFIFFIVRDRIYLYYIMYIFGSIFSFTLMNNYPIVENYIGLHMAHQSITAWIWVTFVGALLFTVEYLDLKSKKKYIYYTINVFIVIFFIFGLLEIFFPKVKVSNVYAIFVPTVFITVLLTAYYMAFKKDKKAIIYSIGWTIVIFSSILYLFVINGFLPYNGLTRSFTYFGVIAEVIIFSIALAQRITVLKEKQEVLNLELTRKNNELILNNESLDSFNYHVSHDLKTVLNNATVLSRMIKKYNDKQDYAKSNEVIEKLQRVTANGSETVQSFLSLGKVDSLISSDNKVTINIDNQISELLTNHNLYDKVKVSIYNPDNITLTMHEKAFESIFLNLITNAIKYCNTFPNVEIDVLKSKGKVFILIKDNGIGIDLTNNKTKVFEPFVRILNEKNVEGTGVGLFLVRKIINSLNGSIQVESELGKGTIFTIVLPSND